MCVSCGESKASYSFVSKKKQQTQVAPCEYTKELIQTWQNLLVCVKNNGKYINAGLSKKDLFRYLGILGSVTEYNNNPCLYINDFPEIYQVVIVIQNLNLCT